MYESAEGTDLFPKTEAEHDEILNWALQALEAADASRRDRADKWKKCYRLYRSYVEKRSAADWRSRVFLPEAFTAIETILPRLVAQLPKFVVSPVGEEDVEPAETMEFLLNNAAEQSGLYPQLVDAFKDALMYGTGIMKVYYDDIKGVRPELQPITEPITQLFSEPLIDPDTQQPLLDPDGNPVIETREEEVGEKIVGYEPVPKPFSLYEGPCASCVNLLDFWVAPEAQDIQTARYVAHRSYVEMSEVKKRIEDGTYKWFGKFEEGEIVPEDTMGNLEFLREVGYDATSDTNRHMGEVIEFWTSDRRQITVLNRKAVVKVKENPFFHGHKPFVRLTDYRMPHEFYGIGEIEAIEGLQDMTNAISNQRIDEVRLKLHKPMAGNPDLLVDLRDLEVRPGQFIRTRSDARPDEILKTIELGDVNASAFTEVDSLQRMIERVTGASSPMQGVSSDNVETATGMSILNESGSSRFGFKVKMFELDPLKSLALQFGSIIQQFTTEEKVVRMLGPNGATVFQTFDPMSLQGAFDYSIETTSIIQSETIKKQQANELFQMLFPILSSGQPLTPGAQALIERILDAHGVKEKAKYLAGMVMMPEQPQLAPVPEMAPEEGMVA